ncbi:MAG: ATP-binding protein [Actinomycetota bacterium]
MCRRCGAENPEGFRFCGRCGAPLEGAEPPREERKVVTALFADLVGFTAMSERLDPEDVRATLSPYFARLRAEIEAHGGTVEKFIGDAVMAVFGAPTAHEDDPERAVRAALAIRDAVTEMSDEHHGLDLHVRVGVDTGEALVSLGASPLEGEGMAAGDVVNTAARLQAAAPVDGILVGERTQRATQRSIDFAEGAPVDAKGKAAPVPSWVALQARSRLGVDVTWSAATPLVGRDRELSVLRDALERVRELKVPHLVTLVGEPGIGKSRLVFELLQVVRRTPALITWRQGRCPPYGDGVGFWAISEMVKAQAGILETDADSVAEEKLRRAMEGLQLSDDDIEWVGSNLRPLVGLATEREARAEASGEAFAAWRRFFEGLAELRPTVLVFEDLHWAGDALLEFVDQLVDWASGIPLLVVCTSRPELFTRREDWGGGTPNATTVALTPLSEDDTIRLFRHLMRRSDLPADLRETLVVRAAGNPLYAEEFARVAADGLDAAGLVELPSSVQGLIAARLDALEPTEKSLLQDASVIGKDFWVGAVTTGGHLGRKEAEERLHRLERRQFVRRVRQSSVAGELEYTFWHPLVRDVAYGEIPRAERSTKHRAAAEWIGSLSDRLEDQADLLAHHYVSALELARSSGGDTSSLEEDARLAFIAAGDRALGLSSFAVAERSYRAALDLWPDNDPRRATVLLRYGRARWSQELAAAETLIEARDALLASSDVEGAAEAEIIIGDIEWAAGRRVVADEHFQRASRLVHGRRPSRSKAWVLAHVSRFDMLGDLAEEAIEIGRQALEMARALEFRDLEANALNNIGSARIALGDRGGFEELESSVAIAEAAASPWDVVRGYINLGAMSHIVGDLRGARRFRKSGLEIAERTGLGSLIKYLREVLPVDLYHEGRWNEAAGLADEFIVGFEAGIPRYNESQVRGVRALIRFARDDVAGAVTDSTLALASSRGSRDPQIFHRALAEHARVMRLVGRTPEALEAYGELFELASQRATLISAWWFLPAAIAVEGLAEADDLMHVAGHLPPSPWIDAGKAWLSADFEQATDILGDMDARTDEAYAQLRAAERLASEGKRPQTAAMIEPSLAFFRSVDAGRYIAEGERLLASLA